MRRPRLRSGACGLVLVIASLLMVSCGGTTSPKKTYGDKLTTWIGADVNALLRSWGPPTQTFPMPNGNTMLVYDSGGPTVVYPPTRGPLGISPGFVTSSNCRTRMEVDGLGRIVHWAFEGNCG